LFIIIKYKSAWFITICAFAGFSAAIVVSLAVRSLLQVPPPG